MSFIIQIAEILILSIATIDTLSFVVSNRKAPESSQVSDYKTICFRWVFLLVLRSLSCSSCCGTFGMIYSFILLVAKAFVTIPLLQGTDKIYSFLIEQNALLGYVKAGCDFAKAKLGKCCQ